MQLHSRCHQFCDVLPLRGRAQFLSRPRNVRWFGGFERHMLRGFNIDIPPRDKRSRARSGDGRLRREKCREACGNDNKISARFREFQRTSKKKKASILSSEEIVSEIKPSIYDCDFLQYTQQIERQFSLEN